MNEKDYIKLEQFKKNNAIRFKRHFKSLNLNG